MNVSATISRRPAAGEPLFARLQVREALRRFAVGGLIVALMGAVMTVIVEQPYTAGSAFGYNLGLVGGLLMLSLLPYALRKRLRCLGRIGTMRGWFVFHIAAGLLGPLLVLFHSTFRIGSFNGGVALVSTLLVTCSGIVGRFLYRKVHRDLNGSRARLGELEASLQEHLDALGPQLERLQGVGSEARRYVERAMAQPARRWQRAAHFLTLGGRRHLVRRRIRRAVRTGQLPAGPAGGEGHHHVAQVLHAIDAVTAVAQRAAQFTAYERLFAVWHAVHIPFLFVLILSAVVHVIAVHAY